MRACRRAAVPLLLLAALAGCTAGGGIDEPLAGKFTWFSYLNGDDLRQRCAPGHWEVRLIYNGTYETQVRTYHLVGDGAAGAYLQIRATPADYGNLARLPLADPLAPWRWQTATRRLSPAERTALQDKLAASGLYGATPEGLQLKSWGWYWVAIACRDGTVHFNAWAYPSQRWEQQQLREVLAPLDDTGVPFTEPRETSPWEPNQNPGDRHRGVHFKFRVGENGLAGHHTLF